METRDAASTLHGAYKAIGEYKRSLEMYELYIVTKDSIAIEDNQKEVIRQQFKYEYEKQAGADSIKAMEAVKVKNAELTAERAENIQRKQQSYFLYAGLGFTLLFGGFIFNRFRVTYKQKGIIEEQKEVVEEAHKEIKDSIDYAKRIQTGLLPSKGLVKEYLKDSFILYKPKDVVAGDFYWIEQIEGKILLAVADCTGHGVPGAMVSVICSSALHRCVREYKLSDPGKILDKTREIVIDKFAQSDEDVKDGMDIALCSFEGNKLRYAGAHNPLWIVRKGEVMISKANKQPIGKFDIQTPFETHEIDLTKGDTIYLFSDGYVDQFGGPKGKKFKAHGFRELLLSIQNQSMEEQFEAIDRTFENWKGNLEQVDDVCIIGVRV